MRRAPGRLPSGPPTAAVDPGEPPGLFTTRGLRKTSLAEPTAPGGIATSSFHAFLAAEEALYLELMIRRPRRSAPG